MFPNEKARKCLSKPLTKLRSSRPRYQPGFQDTPQETQPNGRGAICVAEARYMDFEEIDDLEANRAGML